MIPRRIIRSTMRILGMIRTSAWSVTMRRISEENSKPSVILISTTCLLLIDYGI